jgi:hypothetical protein
MNTRISKQEENGSIDSGRTGTCGTSSTFNFVVGTISLIVAIVIGYLIYTRIFLPPFIHTTSSCDAATSSDIGSSLRIGTYNAQFMVFPADSSKCCDYMTVATRTTRLAQQILNSDYDIFVIQEGFDDEFQDRLTDELKCQYPHYVKYIDGDAVHRDISGIDVDPRFRTPSGFWYCGALDGMDLCSDSGLMVFSKFPFVELPAPKSTRISPENVIAMNDAADWNDVAFKEFTVCENAELDDCWANKGVALVRVVHTDGSIYSIVFTHLDAGGAGHSKEVRYVQLGEIKAFIEETLGPTDGINEQIIFVGDLNINGDYTSPDRVSPVKEHEWERHFASGGSGESIMFYEFLRDTWEFEKHNLAIIEQKNRDQGLTASPDESKWRIDYVFRNSLDNAPLCVQHTTLAYNLFTEGPTYETGFGLGGVRPLSDHFGVNADINQPAPLCSSDIAHNINLIDFDPTYGTITFDSTDTVLWYPGSVQWYVLPDPATYSVYLEGAHGLKYQVYKSTDLTRPVEPYMGLTTEFNVDSQTRYTGNTFVSPNTPLYIKVFHEERSWRGHYTLRVHHNQCTSPEDVCLLLPNQGHENVFSFPSDSVFGAGDFMVFRIDTDAPLTNKTQELTFQIDHDAEGTRVSPSTRYEMELLELDLSASILRSGADSRIEVEDVALNRKSMLLIVRKIDPADPDDILVFWDTNLRVIQLISLKAIKETEGKTLLGVDLDDDDDVRLQIYVSGEAAYDASKRLRLGDFDEGNSRFLTSRARCPIGYITKGAPGYPLDEAVIWLEEDDYGTNDYLKGAFPNSLLNNSTLDLYEVEETDRPPFAGEVPASGSGHGYRRNDDGLYRLQYSQYAGTHNLPYTSAWRANGVIVCGEKEPLDDDGDGIIDTVDIDPTYSNGFTDGFLLGLDGLTSGTIVERAGRDWLIQDEPDDAATPEIEGLRITVGPGTTEGIVKLSTWPASPAVSCSPSDISIPATTGETIVMATCR